MKRVYGAWERTALLSIPPCYRSILGLAGRLFDRAQSFYHRLWEAKLEVGMESSLAFCLAPDSDHFLIGTAHGAALCKVPSFLLVSFSGFLNGH